jgi:ABC-type transporter Mla MlaB component
VSRKSKAVLLGIGLAAPAGTGLALSQNISREWLENAAEVLLLLLVLGGSIGGALWYSQNDHRRRDLYNRQVRLGFQALASQTGLTVIDVAADRYRTYPPFLRGTYRNHRVHVSYLSYCEAYPTPDGGDNSSPGFFRITVSSLDHQRWPEHRQLHRGQFPTDLPELVQVILDQLKTRKGKPLAIEKLDVLRYELTCLAQWADYGRTVQVEGRVLKVIADPDDLRMLLTQLLNLTDSLPSEPE